MSAKYACSCCRDSGAVDGVACPECVSLIPTSPEGQNAASAPRVHELKTWPVYFRAVDAGEKTFEFRRNDRGFAVGDTLRLREVEVVHGYAGAYTGRECLRRVTYIAEAGPIMPEGFCVMSIAPVAAHRVVEEPAGAPTPEQESEADDLLAAFQEVCAEIGSGAPYRTKERAILRNEIRARLLLAARVQSPPATPADPVERPAATEGQK